MKRREFLQHLGGAAAGSLLLKSLWWPVTARALTGQSVGGGKILVVVVMQGGNDGLNTVVPYTNPDYYLARPTLAVPSNTVLTLDGATGLHPSMAALMPTWNAGNMAIIREVGYDDMSLSHFRGTDIIFSGSSTDQVVPTGWLGRWLETQYPDFPDVLPQKPMALQQGFSAQLPLQGPDGVTGVVVFDPSTFSYLVNSTYTGGLSDALPDTPGGDELAFLRSVDVASFQYANEIEAASLAGSNAVSYPNTSLGNQLEIIARLIDGNLDTPVYLSAMGGFDTHANQPGRHPNLLSQFSGAVSAFLADITAMGRADDVTVLTVSEFGRRVGENGSAGTDHGTAAPWFVIGNAVTGGLYGPAPDLHALDAFGNLPVANDYRSVYSTLLRGVFGSDPGLINNVLQGTFPMMGFMAESLSAGDPLPLATRLHAPSPNPVRGAARLRYSLAEASPVQIAVYDVRGRQLAKLAEGPKPAGEHEAVWHAGSAARGVYFVRMQAGSVNLTQKVVVQ